MTVHTAADSLLEYLMQLINCDDELIVKVYEAKLIEKEQIEWFYEEMQFLRKFLKDLDDIHKKHDEKVKVVVAKIRDVIYKVEGTIDLFLLYALTRDKTVKWEDLTFHLTDDEENLGAFTRDKTVNFANEDYCVSLTKREDLMDHRTFHLHRRDDEEDLEAFTRDKTVNFEYEDYCVSRTNRTDLIDNWTFHLRDDGENLEAFTRDKTVNFEYEDYCVSRTNPTDLIDNWTFHLRDDEENLEAFTRDKTVPRKRTDLNDNWTFHPRDDKVSLVGVLRRDRMAKFEYEDYCVSPRNRTDLIYKWTFQQFSFTSLHHLLKGVIGEMKFIKTEVMQIYDEMMYGIGAPQIEKSCGGHSIRVTSPVVEDKQIIVGLEDETTAIIDLLTQEHEKQLKVIPIVGMPGLGKTTLATKVYNHSLIRYHFYVCAWTHVSQVYHKRDLLLSILNSANIEHAYDKMLGEKLYKHLKGNRYLIVLDDIWNISAWNDLKIYLPNDNNGSRIIFTTRVGDVVVSLHSKPHYMRFLNEEESWDLLRHKAFQNESCPPDLMELGKRIARKCEGLPLAIVVISGLLSKNDKTQDWWRLVAQSVSSYIVADPQQYMDTLALSYDCLPNHLKPCFLYFAAFPEDCEIPVRQLTWLWVANGFIRQIESKTLEDVAAGNLMDLIGRSLVLVSKKRSNGGIKACRIHDLLRDLCLRKAKEENLLDRISWYKKTSSSSSSSSSNLVRNKRSALHVRTFLSLKRDLSKNLVSVICRRFKLVRILNLSSVNVPFFPREIQLLIHLRYLALHISSRGYFKSSISNLRNLETYIVRGFGGNVNLPDNMWKMVKLRHLYTKHLFILLKPIYLRNHSALYNLQTIGKLDLRYRNELVLPLMPNLRKLNCSSYEFPKLDFLIYLETLQVSCKGFKGNGKLPQTNWFPPNLKNLTLSFFHLLWEEMWTLGRLPNLEVLKLSYDTFNGSTWDANDIEFRTLRFLELRGLNIEQWNASSNNFPNLQRLVLYRCRQLKEIPNGLGDISTLEMIQVQYCSSSVETSAKQIQEQQQNLGNDGLNIFVQGVTTR